MPHKEPLHIVFTTDDGHSMLTGVAIRSLVAEFEKSPKRDRYTISIHVISLNLSAENKMRIARCAESETAEAAVRFLDYELKTTQPGKDRFAELITILYYLPDLLPDLGRVICADADIMFTGDISALWEVDLDGNWLGAVPCIIPTDGFSLRNYNYPFKIKYATPGQPVNTGVLLMDLERMRQLNVTGTLVKWTTENRDKALLVNQEAIALNFPEQWKALGHEWNFRLFAEPYWTSSWSSFKQYMALKPSVVHFQNHLRPHALRARLPRFEQWRAHLSHTPWSGSLQPKKVNYLFFVYFEYFEAFGFLNRLFRSLNIKLLLLCGVMLPVTLPKYFQYLLRPLEYRFRICKDLPDLEPLA